MNKIIIILSMLLLIISACSLPGMVPPTVEPSSTIAPLPSNTIQPSETPSPLPTLTITETPSPTITPIPSDTPTLTPLPTVTETSGPSATPTVDAPTVTVNKQAHCRYGPHVAYLHAADLYAGDKGIVVYRVQLSKWLFIKFEKLNYHCWVAPSVVDVTGDVNVIKVVEFTDKFLPGPSVLYDRPHGVTSVRDGNKVTISWEMVKMTDDDDRGYFLELYVCQDGAYIWYPVSLDNRDKTTFTIKDEAGCHVPSKGRLFAVEKHGYTKPFDLNWPLP